MFDNKKKKLHRLFIFTFDFGHQDRPATCHGSRSAKGCPGCHWDSLQTAGLSCIPKATKHWQTVGWKDKILMHFYASHWKTLSWGTMDFDFSTHRTILHLEHIVILHQIFKTTCELLLYIGTTFVHIVNNLMWQFSNVKLLWTFWTFLNLCALRNLKKEKFNTPVGQHTLSKLQWRAPLHKIAEIWDVLK